MLPPRAQQGLQLRGTQSPERGSSRGLPERGLTTGNFPLPIHQTACGSGTGRNQAESSQGSQSQAGRALCGCSKEGSCYSRPAASATSARGRDEVGDQSVLECSPPGPGGLKSSSLTLLTHSRGPSWPHLVDVKANGQIFTLAIPAGRLFRPLLDADQHFIFRLLDIKDVLQGWPRERDTAIRPCQRRACWLPEAGPEPGPSSMVRARVSHGTSPGLGPSSMTQAYDAHPAGGAGGLGDIMDAQLRACMQSGPNEGTPHMRTKQLPGS